MATCVFLSIVQPIIRRFKFFIKTDGLNPFSKMPYMKAWSSNCASFSRCLSILVWCINIFPRLQINASKLQFLLWMLILPLSNTETCTQSIHWISSSTTDKAVCYIFNQKLVTRIGALHEQGVLAVVTHSWSHQDEKLYRYFDYNAS